MSKTFVLDPNKKPLNPCPPAEARLLLRTGQAAVFRRYPFTLILKKEIPQPEVHRYRLKLDPGSKTTGIAIVDEQTSEVVFAAELQHRADAIGKAMLTRHSLRRVRRQRKTRYRAPRFLNRRRPKGWLTPCMRSRLANVLTWVQRLRRLCPIAAISVELVQFDTQKLQNPEITGAEYQQGELFGYEVREYLLEKFERACVYCGANDTPLQVEHIIPKIRGGSSRVSNLTIACCRCNQAKGHRTAEEFGHPEVQARAKAPLRDAAAVNSIRKVLYQQLQATGLPVEAGTGGQTKFNRTRLGLAKAHWLDAACVGASTPENLKVDGVHLLRIKATGHGHRQMCRTNKFGFPICHRTRQKTHFGFQTGDLACAYKLSGKHAGIHTGRVSVRARPSFLLDGIDIHPKYLKRIHRADGYTYR